MRKRIKYRVKPGEFDFSKVMRPARDPKPKGSDKRPLTNLQDAPSSVRDALPMHYSWIDFYQLTNKGSLVFLQARQRHTQDRADRIEGKPLPYKFMALSAHTSIPDTDPISVMSDGMITGRNTLTTGNCSESHLYVKAFADLQSQLKGFGTGWGMNIATGRDTLELSREVATRITSGLRHLRRGNVGSAFLSLVDPRAVQKAQKEYRRLEKARKRALRQVRRRKFVTLGDHLRYIRQPNGGYRRADLYMANDYLAFTYGIEPLIGDIYASIKGNSDAADLSFPVRGRAYGKENYYNFRDYGRSGSKESWGEGEAFIEIGTSVSLDNENTRLWSDLGLTNVPIIVNDLIKFSFVANWWTRHELLLESLTMWSGLKRKNEYKTYFRQGRFGENNSHRFNYYGDLVGFSRLYKYTLMDREVTAVRTPSLNETFRLWPFASQRRAVNAAALVRTNLLNVRSK